MPNPEALELLREVDEKLDALLMDRRGFTVMLTNDLRNASDAVKAALNPNTAWGLGLHP